jgi:hypothetical protein
VAVTLLNTPAAGTIGGTLCTGTYNGYTPAAGDLLIAVPEQIDNLAKINSPAFTNSQGWTLLVTAINATSGTSEAAVEIWAKQAAGSDAAPQFTPQFASGGTQTHNCAVAAVYALGGADMSNFAGLSFLDTSGTYASGSSAGTLSSMTVTTSAAPSASGGFAVSGFAQERANATVTWTDTASPAFTTDCAGSTAANLGPYAGHLANPATSGAVSDSGSFSVNTTAFGAGVVAVIKALAGAPGVPPHTVSQYTGFF